MEQPLTNAEYAYRSLRQKILRGELKSGERLRINELTEQLGISNSPIIEAMRRLEQDGLVESRPNAGVRVQQWSAEDIASAILTREALEGIAARLFVLQANDIQREKLTLLNQHFHQAVQEQSDPLLWVEADAAFHQHIFDSIRSRPLVKAASNSFAISITFWNINAENRRNFPAPPAGVHDALALALQSDNAAVAEQAARKHVHEGLNMAASWGVFGKDVKEMIALLQGTISAERS
jgi:DNA-binding GntR family transcriptional regulator